MKHKRTPVNLTPEQIAAAKEANGQTKHIAHAIFCGPYGQMFGMEKQRRKYFEAWRPDREQPISPELFDTSAETDDCFERRDFASTLNLFNILMAANDQLEGK